METCVGWHALRNEGRGGVWSDYEIEPMDFLQLSGKNVLIFGVSNRKSVAYHIGRVLSEAGAECVYVVQNDEIRRSVANPRSNLPGDSAIYVCDVEHEDQICRLREEIGDRFGRFHGLVHSIAFADYSEGVKAFHETPKAAFLRAVDVSCFSLIALSRAFADLLDRDASVVTISISTTRMASENYGYMRPSRRRSIPPWRSWRSPSALFLGCGSMRWPRDC